MISIVVRSPLICHFSRHPQKFIGSFSMYTKNRIANITTCNKLLYSFSSTPNQTIKSMLEQIQVDIKGQKKSILNSGLISSYTHNPQTNKSIITVASAKDFPKIRAILVRTFKNVGHDVEIVMEQRQEKKIFQRRGNLMEIKNVIAVSSCKGGVGKSTVAVNIAFGLSQQGFKVGLFDSDVYGPSIPTLVRKQGETLESAPQNATHILPKQVRGVKCMSFGFVANQPAAMRGPMASSIISQLLLNTRWGKLDYLIVDTPPGTGDVNLSLCEELKFNGAVIVSTPQRLAFIDVMKGIQVFQALRVRILAIVENMSYYSCPKCETIEEIFGPGHNKMITQQLGIDNSYRIPLMSQISKYSDAGTPAVLALPQQHLIRKTYLQICTEIKKQLQKPQSKAGAFYSTTDRLVIVQQGKKDKKIDPFILRSKCRCLQCVNQQGEVLLDTKTLDPEVYPVKIEEKGNYAIGIAWSDGHRNSIYSYRRLFSDQIPPK